MGHERNASITNPNGPSVQRHLVGTESASTQRSRNTKRRQVTAARTNERCDAARDPVFVESEKVVSKSRGCVAQFREWRLYYRPFFNQRPQPVRALPRWTRLRSRTTRRTRVGGVRKHHDIAGRAYRAHHRVV